MKHSDGYLMKISWLCWAARIVGALVGFFWLFIAIVTVISGYEILDWQGWTMLVLVAFSLVAIAIAWWRAGTGTILLFLVALLHGIFALLSANQQPFLAFTFSLGPFLLTGLLFWGCWYQKSKAR